MDTNSFEIRPFKQQSKIRAIFTQASMFSHDCVPNTRHVFTENYEMLMIATGMINIVIAINSIKILTFATNFS